MQWLRCEHTQTLELVFNQDASLLWSMREYFQMSKLGAFFTNDPGVPGQKGPTYFFPGSLMTILYLVWFGLLR